METVKHINNLNTTESIRSIDKANDFGNLYQIVTNNRIINIKISDNGYFGKECFMPIRPDTENIVYNELLGIYVIESNRTVKRIDLNEIEYTHEIESELDKVFMNILTSAGLLQLQCETEDFSTLSIYE